MKKKYILIMLIMLILINIGSISARDNNDTELEIVDDDVIDIDDNTLNSAYDDGEISSKILINQTDGDVLMQSDNKEVLSDFSPFSTEITLTVKDTNDFNTTGNITINMHLSFNTPDSDGEFSTYNINVYENNTLIKQINIGDLNLHEVTPRVNYTADIPFTYILRTDSYLTTSIFGKYSNTLYFEKTKNNLITNLNNTQINIDNTYYSNKSWNNSILTLRKAIELVSTGGVIYLNNIDLIQDINETIKINKNITIIAYNTSILLDNKQTLLEIEDNTNIVLVNLTFSGNNQYIISNKGNLKIINSTFKDNSQGLINNDGELELENCKITDINQFYQTNTDNINGLITNTKTLKIINTVFNNNNNYLPYSLPTGSDTLKGIIYNKGNLNMFNVNFTNINYRIIYNDGKISINKTLFENITSISNTIIYITSSNQQLDNNYSYANYNMKSNSKTIDGGAIYNNKELTVTDSYFKNIVGSNGGGIYNNNNLNIINTTFQEITANNGGAIYNTNQLTILNSLIYKTQTTYKYNDHDGGGIYNTGTCIINNSNITETKNSHYGGGIYNTGTLKINNTLFSKITGESAVALYNGGTMSINNSKIINNHAPDGILIFTDYGGWGTLTSEVSGLIFNNANAKATITNSLIKDNTIEDGPYNGYRNYFGIVRNSGVMEIISSIFDNNTPIWDGGLHTGGGSFNIYNTGTITVMYTYLLNTQTYSIGASDVHSLSPVSFLHNVGKATLNYNYYCLPADKIIKNADPNYYFTAGFEKEYYPIKLNENINITLTLALTNGQDTITFSEWDKLPGQLAFNTTITTINENGEWINITTQLTDKYTFNFNYTGIKKEYNITATVLDYSKHTVLVDVGKEFANLTVEYSNITYNDGEIDFKINVTGDYGTPTGNITLIFNNQKNIIPLINGTCNYTLPSTLKPGNYTVKISYEGDDTYFKLLNNNYQCSVYKIKTNITVTATEVRYGETGKITITITPDDAKLYGKLYVDGEYCGQADTQSTRTLSIKRPAGIYNITVVFDEDEYYESGSATTLFIVNKWKTNLTLTSRDIPEGESVAVLNLTINPGDVRGDAILSINGVNSTIYIGNTVTPITITDLREGYYTVSVYYPGDRKYAPSNATTTFSVSRKHTDLSVTISSNDDLTGNIVVNTDFIDCTGKVGVYINNDDVLIKNLSDGSASFNVKFKRGTNYIYVVYLGDKHYKNASWNTTTHIEGSAFFNASNNILTEQKLDYYILKLFDTENNPYEYTDFIFIFENQTFNLTTDENGTVKIPIQIKAGTYTITAKYKNTTYNDTITVNPSKIIINVNDILFGEAEIITVTLPENASGNITYIIDDDKIITGSTNISIPNLSIGEHKITVIYSGDNNFINQTMTVKFNVKEAHPKITITTNITSNITEQELNYYIINLFDTANNRTCNYTNISISFKNQIIDLTTDENGTVKIPIQTKAGTYIITVTCGNITHTDSITINPAKIRVDIKDILADENEIITVILPEGALGNITFIIDNDEIMTGSGRISIPGLSAGEHELTVIYSGNDKYINQTINMKFSIKIATSQIKITSLTNEITYGESVIITASVTDGATGSVTFTLNRQTQTVNITGGKATAVFKNTPAGKYELTAHYNGDTIYQGSTTSASITVKKAKTNLTLNTSSLVLNTNIRINAILNNDATGNITFHIQGLYSPRNRTITNGVSSWLISPLNPGSYYLIVKYNGDNNYESASNSKILILNQTPTILNVTVSDINEEDDLIVYVTLTDTNNNGLSGDVVFEIGGNYYRIIVSNGTGSRNLGEFKGNNYTYTATYTGTTSLSMAIATGTVNVEANIYNITGNKNIKQYYGANKYYKIRLLNNNQPVKNAIITIKINKKTVYVKTDSNGYATLKLKLKAGKYTITSTYKNIKVSNKITVKKTLITKNKKIKKGKTLKFKAKLLSKKGKVLKNKKITFKLKGKKYKAKTNKKGIATIKIKNLKVGKYKIKTTYGKLKNTNTIKVKK